MGHSRTSRLDDAGVIAGDGLWMDVPKARDLASNSAARTRGTCPPSSLVYYQQITEAPYPHSARWKYE